MYERSHPTLAVCSPLRLDLCANRMDQGLSRIYRRHLITNLLATLKRQRRHLERVDPAQAKRLAALSHVTTDRIDLSQLDLRQLKGAVGVKTTAYLTDPYLRFATDAAVRVDVRVSKTQ